MSRQRLAVYTTVYPQMRPYFADWYASLRAQTDRDVDVWIGLDRMSAQDVLDLGADHVVIATGCHWRRDGFGRSHGLGIADFADNARVFTPDDLMDGRWPEGRVVVYDDDYFYTASVVAEALRLRGCEVTYLTPDDTIASWSANTLDYRHIQWRMAELGVVQRVSHLVTGYTGTTLALEHAWSAAASSLECDAVVVVTARLPDDALYQALKAREPEWTDAGIRSVACIGDALAPGLIAHAVYAGHRYAQELDARRDGEVPFKRHFHHDPTRT